MTNELLNIGKRIRHFRIRCGMTQTALGIAAGFSQETADVRIAQYESGTRTPKHNMLCRIADVLGVSVSALDVPTIKSSDELCCLLTALKEECGIELLLSALEEGCGIKVSLQLMERCEQND